MTTMLNMVKDGHDKHAGHNVADFLEAIYNLFDCIHSCACIVTHDTEMVGV